MIPVCIYNEPQKPLPLSGRLRAGSWRMSWKDALRVSRLGVSSSLKGIHVPVAIQRVE